MRTFLIFLVVLLAVSAMGQDRGTSYDGTLKAFSKWYASDAADSIYGMFSTQMKGKVIQPNARSGAAIHSAVGNGFWMAIHFGACSPITM